MFDEKEEVMNKRAIIAIAIGVLLCLFGVMLHFQRDVGIAPNSEAETKIRNPRVNMN